MLAFGQSASRLVGDYAGQRYNELIAQAREAGDTSQGRALADEAARWAEGGAYRVAAHAALGAIAGGVDGALGAGMVAQAAPLLDTLQTSVQARLQDAGMSPDAARAAATVISTGAATLVGAAAGNGNAQAAAMAFNVDANNRQLHPSEVQWIARNARGFAQQLSEQLGRPVTDLEAMQWLTAAGQSNVDEAAQRSNGNFVRGPGFGEEAQAYDAAKAFIVGNTRSSAFTDERGQTQPLFTARNGDFYRPEVYGQYRNDPNYREYFWQVQGVNLRPDNPTAQDQQQYDQRQAQLNAQTPKELLLIAGPVALQAAVGRIGGRGVGVGSGPVNDEQLVGTSNAGRSSTARNGADGGATPPSADTPALPRAADATADSAYNSTGRPYGQTSTTDANGNAVPTGASLPNTSGATAAQDAQALARLNGLQQQYADAGVQNPHFVDRHGPQTTLDQQYQRATGGGWPNPGTTTPQDASRFFNASDMESAIQQAVQRRANGETGPIPVDFGRPVGEGYVRALGSPGTTPQYRQTNVVVINFDSATGLPYTAFPNIKEFGVPLPDPRQQPGGKP
jgi:hypothetical protein